MADLRRRVLTFSNEVQDALANLKERRERDPVNLEEVQMRNQAQYCYEDIIFFMLLAKREATKELEERLEREEMRTNKRKFDAYWEGVAQRRAKRDLEDIKNMEV